MRKLLLFVGVSTVLMLVSSVAVLAQAPVPDPSGQYEPTPAAQYEPERADLPLQYSDKLPEDAANQYGSDPSCEGPCAEVQSIAGGIRSGAEDASGPSEDLPRALDAASSDADGEDGPAFASELAEEDPADGAPGSDRGTAASPGAAGGGGSRPLAPPAQGERAKDGPEGTAALKELPATGAPVTPAGLGAGAFLLLAAGGLLVRRVVVG